MRVSVVIPIHNEASTLPAAVPALMLQLAQVDADFDVSLMENGSTDDTVMVAEGLAAQHAELRTVSLPEPNYGAAMHRGFLEAQGDWVVNFDIDYFSGPFVAEAIGLEADIVVASKRAPGANDTRGMLRRIATLTFNNLLRVLFGVGVSDTHGMKAVRRHVVEAVGRDVISTKDMFDTELIIRADRAGFSIAELPATVTETREARSSIWRRVPRTLVGLFRLRVAMWRSG